MGEILNFLPQLKDFFCLRLNGLLDLFPLLDQILLHLLRLIEFPMGELGLQRIHPVLHSFQETVISFLIFGA